MRIASSQILLTAKHALTEKHTRRESLVAGVSSTGEWNAARGEGGTERVEERTQSLPFAGGASATSPPTLLDEYLGGRSLESVERDAAVLQAGEVPGQPGPRGGLARPASGGGSDGVAGDLELLARLASQEPRRSGLQDLARLVAAGSQELARLVAGGNSGGGTGPHLLERAAASGFSLPDLDALRQRLASLDAEEGGDLLSRLFTAMLPSPLEGYASLDAETDSQDRLKMDLIRAAVEAFSGRRLRILGPSDLDFGGPTGAYAAPIHGAGPPPEGADEVPEQAPGGPAFGLRYSLRETHYERETTTFQAQGVVQTTDGQKIDVDVSLTMGRQFYREESVEVRIGAALQDPLVVNFEGTAAELTERTFAFDLDGDGEAEQIHFVGPNSGFLAYDRNGNGAVDDGSELFGPATGQGFAELSNYDEDGNRFIDEADSVYQGLRIWQKDATGNDRLLALGEAGVGAIYLGHTDTPFQVKDDQNQLQGVVKSSGIYLKEDGGTGTMQQLDLVV